MEEVTTKKINTSLEARNLVNDPTKLLSLLQSKYSDINEEYFILYANQLIFKRRTHFSLIYKENQYDNSFIEFLKRYYDFDETIFRMPKLYEYYKNYHKFYCKPIFRSIYIGKLLHNYEDNKAEIFYKNNYTHSNSSKNNYSHKKSISSTSTDNRIIFDKKTKFLLETSNNNYYYNTKLIKKRNEKQNQNANDKKSKSFNINISKIINNETLNFFTNRSKDSFVKEIINFFSSNNNNNINSNENIQKINKNPKFNQSQRNSIKITKKAVLSKNNDKSPTSFQMQIKLIKNVNYNKNKTSMYMLSKKNSNSKSKSHNNKIKNILFSPTANNNLCIPKIYKTHNKYSNFYLCIRKNKRNRTNNNSINETLKQSLNNVCKNITKHNITYNNRFYSNSNSYHNSMKTTCNKSNINTNTNKANKRKKFILEINKKISHLHKKNKTFDNINKKVSELKKNFSNSNILAIKCMPILSQIKPINKLYHSKINIIKYNSSNFVHKQVKSNINNLKNKRINHNKDIILKKNCKSMISVSTGTTPKFSNNIKNIRFSSKNHNKSKSKINFNLTSYNISKNISKILKNNNSYNTAKKNKNRKKNNISYTNYNYNINFNNVIFCSPRISNPNNQHTNSNIISDNNYQNNKSNNLYGVSRNNNVKMSVCSRTQSQTHSLIKNLKYNTTKMLYKRKSNLYFNKNKFDENKILQTNKINKYQNKIANLKINKFSASHKKQLGHLDNSKHIYHEIFSKNIRKLGINSIKLNQLNNHIAIKFLNKKDS